MIRELNKIPVQTFDLPDQTLCFQFVYLIDLESLKKVKPVVLKEVERYFKIKLNEKRYFRLIRDNNTFKEYFIRKLDEHVSYSEFHEVLFRKSQIFERIVVAYNDKIGDLQTFELHQHCLIKKLIKTFYACYTFSCSRVKVRDHFDNKTGILDDEPQSEFGVKGFVKFKIKQRYLLSFMGKNVVFKIFLNRRTFLKNGLRSFRMSLHEANTFPRHIESLIHVVKIKREGFRQLYTYTFLHVKRLKAPYKSNCTQRIEYKIRRECEDKHSKDLFNSLLFGNYYSREVKYDNLSLGLNQQYFFYKYNRQALENITVECSIRTSLDQCDEYIYYVFTNLALPSDKMILQLMVPINANYLCEDRPKLNLSEYLLKSLSIINFWFGFTIIQMLFNLHDDALVLYKKTVVVGVGRDKDYLIMSKDQQENHDGDYYGEDQNGERKELVGNKANYQLDIVKDHRFDRIELRNRKNKSSKSGFFGKLFRLNKSEDNINDYLMQTYLDSMARNRAILYRNLQLNNWIYNPLTYSGSVANDDLAPELKSSFAANKTVDLNTLVRRAIKSNDALMDEANSGWQGETGKTRLMKLEEKLAGKLGNKLGEKPAGRLHSSSVANKNQSTDQSNGDQLTNDNLPSNLNARTLNFESKGGPRRALNVRFNDVTHKNSPPNELELFSRSPERLRLPDKEDHFSGQSEVIKNLTSKWKVIKDFLFPPRPGQQIRETNLNVIFHSPISKPSAM